MDIFFIIILGLVIGSFLNVCIFRIPKEESIKYPPSRCDKCKKRLKALDLIPLVSYIIFKGRCRYCGEKIDVLYPIIELLNCILYAVIFLKFGLNIFSFKFYILSSILIVIAVIDYKTKYIYESTIITGTVIGILSALVQFFFTRINIEQFIIGGLIGFIVLEIIRIISGGIGSGDCEVAAICGIFLGIKGVVSTLLLSIFICGSIGILLLVLRFKKRNDKIAFAPFISISAFLTILYGNAVINFYMKFLELN